MRTATIAGTGLYAPERVVTNQYFNEMYKKDIDTFLKEQRNIHERRWMSEEQATSDLILPAAEEAMKNAGITAKEIDLIVVATDTPDYVSPRLLWFNTNSKPPMPELLISIRPAQVSSRRLILPVNTLRPTSATKTFLS